MTRRKSFGVLSLIVSFSSLFVVSFVVLTDCISPLALFLKLICALYDMFSVLGFPFFLKMMGGEGGHGFFRNLG